MRAKRNRKERKKGNGYATALPRIGSRSASFRKLYDMRKGSFGKKRLHRPILGVL